MLFRSADRRTGVAVSCGLDGPWGNEYLFKVGLDKGEPLLDDAFNVSTAVSHVSQNWNWSAEATEQGLVLVLLLDRQVSASASQKIFPCKPGHRAELGE